MVCYGKTYCSREHERAPKIGQRIIFRLLCTSGDVEIMVVEDNSQHILSKELVGQTNQQQSNSIFQPGVYLFQPLVRLAAHTAEWALCQATFIYCVNRG